MTEVGEPEFRQLFERELSYVWHSLRRLGVRPEDARDQAQEVFLIVHRLLPSYDRARPLRPWLFGIAFRVAARYRDRERLRRTEDLPTHVADGTPGADEQLFEAQQRRLVLRALEAIDLDRRAVFVLAEIDGASAPQIAQALGIPLNTVYSRLRRAREEFTQAARRLARSEKP
jgi:RNA polymerase sigma-70 factor (ECF subfamily)